MKPLILSAMLALAAPVASAGDLSFEFGFRKVGGDDRVRVGVRYEDDHRRGHRDVRRPARGHWEVVTHRVWIPGHYDVVHRPAVYRYHRDPCGDRVRYLVRPAHTVRVWCPGRYETRTERVWVAGR